MLRLYSSRNAACFGVSTAVVMVSSVDAAHSCRALVSLVCPVILTVLRPRAPGLPRGVCLGTMVTLWCVLNFIAPRIMTTATADSFRRDAQVIGLVGLAHGTSHFFHLALASLFPWLKDAFVLSYAELGLLMTVFFIVSGVGQALAGFAVDRFGALPVLLSGIALLGLAALGLAASQNYPMLILFAGVAGLGNSVFHPADFTLLNRRVTVPRLGHAFSVHGLAGTLGWAL